MVKLSRLINTLSIRSKLTVSYMLIFILMFAILGFFIHSMIRDTIYTNTERELKNVTDTILNMVETTLDTSIRNYLRSIAVKNRETVEYFFTLSTQGKITEQEAKLQAAGLLLNQVIGKTGYTFVWDIRHAPDSIPLAVHPVIQGEDVAYVDFVQHGAAMKEGYIEYDWQNPGEKEPRAKSMYLSYFAPWEWVIAASSYREEFFELIDVSDFRQQILSLKFGTTGYSYILDSKGNVVLHSKLSGNVYNITDGKGWLFIQEICRQKSGKIVYSWKKPGEEEYREKLVIFNYLPEFDWIVASSTYMEEILEPLNKLQRTLSVALLLLLLVVLIFTSWISSHITRPLLILSKQLKKGIPEDFSIQIPVRSNDEIGQLTGYFNTFMKNLKEYNDSLHREIVFRKAAEEKILESENRFRTIIDSMPSIIVGVDPEGRITHWNRKAERETGINTSEAIGKPLGEALTAFGIEMEKVRESISTNIPFRDERVLRKTKGKSRYLDITIYPLIANKINGAVIRIDDVTELVAKEEQLRQAQKMETVGTLAGGFAHDFNNVLGGIMGALSILESRFQKEDPRMTEGVTEYLEIIKGSSLRAAEMVRQLLTFSHKQEMNVAPLDLNLIVKNVMKICKNSLNKSVSLISSYFESPAMVNADSNQIEQALLNLCINADHAMTTMRTNGAEWGGTLEISLENIEPDHYFRQLHPEAREGAYWLLSVKDTGIGMDKNIVSKVFNPFFTTKEKGKGTGLGLAMVYNSIKQHDGFIDVYTEEGIGTKFNVYLPVPAEEIIIEKKEERDAETHRGEGLVLVIDDEQIMRTTAKSILEEHGYKVIVAENGKAGIEIFKKHRKEIKAVLLDMAMPGMSGKEVYKKLKNIDFGVKVLLSSGFGHDERVKESLADGVDGFLQKPYSLEKLVDAVYEVIAKNRNK
jgi:PAS domain S-box-containing protein